MYGSGGKVIAGTGVAGTSLALTGFPTFGFILLAVLMVMLGAVLLRVGAMRWINGSRSGLAPRGGRSWPSRPRSRSHFAR